MKESKFPLPESVDIAQRIKGDIGFKTSFYDLCRSVLAAKNEEEYQDRFAFAVQDLVTLLGHTIPDNHDRRFDLITKHDDILTDLLYCGLVNFDLKDSHIFSPESIVSNMPMFRAQIQEDEIAYLARLPEGRKKDWRINYLARCIIRMQLGYSGNFTDQEAAFQLISLKAQIRNRIREEGGEAVGYGHS